MTIVIRKINSLHFLIHSVLQPLHHTSSKNPQIQNILIKHHEISKSKTVIYCWIPSHIGIYNNAKLTKKAKEYLNLEETDFKIPFNNFKPSFKRYVLDKWQTLWNKTPYNKFKEIQLLINQSKAVLSPIRREDPTRLRTGHTRITHAWLLNREEQRYCNGCDTHFTVKLC